MPIFKKNQTVRLIALFIYCRIKTVLYLFYASLLVLCTFLPAKALAPLITVTELDYQAGQGLGQCYRMDGDLDGDGIDDIVSGLIRWQSTNDTGRILIYWGGENVSSTPDVVIDGEAVNTRFGDGLSVGDFNGDGIDDLASGAIETATNDGKVYVLYGRSRAAWSSVTNASQANVKITGDTDSHLGNKVGLEGDINGDGYNDLLMGAEYWGASDQGRAYILFGEDNDSINITVANVDVIINNDFGAGVSALGDDVYIADVAGDSYPDILISVGDWLDGDGGQSRVIIFNGSASFPTGTINASTANAIILANGNTDFEGFGYAVRAGDVNSDGKKDLLVGSDHFITTTGLPRLSIFYGGPGISGTMYAVTDADQVIIGEAEGDLFSMAIMTGDINNDGVDDIATTAYFYPTPWVGPGRLYIFYGGSGLASKTNASQADYIMENPLGISLMGWWVAVGDINNDGWDEVGEVYIKESGVTTTLRIFGLSHLSPVVTINSPSISYSGGQAGVQFTGSATDPDSGNIQRVQYSLDGGSWQSALPSDGSFGSTSEDYYFDLTITSNGSYGVRVRASDSENATTSEASYAVSSFDINGIITQAIQTGILPETGAGSDLEPALALLILPFVITGFVLYFQKLR
ncbi:MAG: Ig-like domain-containing protein [Candidatus Berkelbacteria bacterium]|nr:Ig-like domain-containing protein [Candidatus Berkelbacteria bacterium]